MKSLRVISKVAIATLIFFLCTSLTPVKEHSSLKKDNTYYYWYLGGGTVYDGWCTTAQEITSLENWRIGMALKSIPIPSTER